MSRATIMAVVNQKGGTGKTTTCENLGIGLANEGKRVLLVDTDPQASLTIALGHPRPDDLPVTLTDLMAKVMQDQPIAPKEGILSHEEGVDLVPANITLSGMEVSLVNAMSRETVLRQVLDDAGFSPICPRLMYEGLLRDEIPQEHKDRIEMASELLRRSRILVVCGDSMDGQVKDDIGLAKRLRIAATTLDGIMKVEGSAGKKA